MDVKKSLLMPNTGFEMRGNLSTKEPLEVKRWHSSHYYQKMLENRKGSPEFQLHDGPPYANGDMHIGHLLNRVLKDIVLRYKNMSGFYTPFVFGWDTHGLPIENLMTKRGINRKTMSVTDFRDKCSQFALEQVANQKEQIRRLGVMGDFDHPYMTLSPEYEARQIDVFARMALKGLIYKGLKPVYWSPSSESALAEAEIEYADVTSTAIYVGFKIKNGKKLLSKSDQLVIWTTTPWTLPANLAISAHPDFEYGLYDTDKGRLVFLKDLQKSLEKALSLTRCELLKTFTGLQMEKMTVIHPFYDRESLVIVGEHVTNETGTGLVHTAPGHGEEDFIVGQKYHLAPLCPVDGRGMMTQEAGPILNGLFYEEANTKVLELLTTSGALLASHPYTHSYPHDWRTGKPLIYRATPQWFCSIEPIREKLLKEIDRVKWTPSWGQGRIHNMIRDRGDWCISRQRAWGVPIPIIYHEDGTPIIEQAVFEHISGLFRKHGSGIWFTKTAIELLPIGYQSPHSPSSKFLKETDIMDVWFDSGSSSSGVLLERGLKFPSDLYLEGSDQYRGWFNSSLIIGVAAYGVSPYQSIVSHGFVVDGLGEKMSKSKGNGIDPQKVFNTYGVDILRLWVSTIDYQADVRASDDIFKGNAETYRKIRNTFKFMLGNLSDGENGRFMPSKDSVKVFSRVDEYVLSELNQVVLKVKTAMDNYDFSGSMMVISNFISGDLSSFYCDITKDILYCEKKDSLRRRQVQTVLYRCVDTLLRLLTPILPFTMEEVFSYLPEQKVEFAQLLYYPTVSLVKDNVILDEYHEFLKLRQKAMKALEVARTAGTIGSAQEAELIVNVENDSLFLALKKIDSIELNRYFIVSRVKLVQQKNQEEILVTRHLGKKCDRCWNYYDSLTQVEDVHVCPRCLEALGTK